MDTSTYYLTKSDFKAARTCPTKLYYRKNHYPTSKIGDDFLEMLAEQGYLIEALARTLYPDGREVGFRQDVVSAARETMAALTNECTLFEATFISGSKMARADILVRRGNVFELIEIKSRGFDRHENDERLREGKLNIFRAPRSADGIAREWRPYLEDATYQTAILRELFPDAQVIPYLLMPDKSRPTRLNGLHRHFDMRELHHETFDEDGPSADYRGEVDEFRNDPFLVRVDISAEVDILMPEVLRQTTIFLESLSPTLRRVHTVPSMNCRDCEYRVTDGQLSGFNECWGELADVKPHIFDLYYVGNIKDGKEPLANSLIASGRAGLFDIPEERIARKDGTVGSTARRQRLQIQCMREGREWISDEIAAILESFEYPLHFVDFETCNPAVPRYSGMRPFETIAFQWSCHTIHRPGNAPRHHEWLQTGDDYPNGDFAASLREQVGEEGSILVWAIHESSTLKAVRQQLAEREGSDPALLDWLERVVADGRIIDLNRLTLDHYFHPRMRGRTSLKVVVDAVWQASPAIRARYPQYLAAEEDGFASPYKSLPPTPIDGRDVSVAEGVGAILAYYKMIEHEAGDESQEAGQWRHLLQQYCTLDTLAMVMVWSRWRELCGQMD